MGTYKLPFKEFTNYHNHILEAAVKVLVSSLGIVKNVKGKCLYLDSLF